MIYDYVIVGGGISGLNGVELLKKINLKVLIVEKNPSKQVVEYSLISLK